jgi:hypothetical protein
VKMRPPDGIALRLVYHNFSHVCKTLRATPAMEAGIANHVWRLDKIVGLFGNEREDPREDLRRASLRRRMVPIRSRR